MYIGFIPSNEEIKELLKELPGSIESILLDELLQDHELQGKVLSDAQSEIYKIRKKKPCPHCKSTAVYKRGKQRGVQMYNCKDCNKWFSETTETPLYEIKVAVISELYGTRYAHKEDRFRIRNKYPDKL